MTGNGIAGREREREKPAHIRIQKAQSFNGYT
jgi:hypothetical protein